MLPRPLRRVVLLAAALAAALAAGASGAAAAVPIPTAVRMTVTPGRDVTAPFVFTVSGRLVFHTPVPGGACAGIVAIALKANGQAVMIRSPKVDRTCTFKVVLSVPRRARFHGAKTLVVAGQWFRLGASTSVVAQARTLRVR